MTKSNPSSDLAQHHQYQYRRLRDLSTLIHLVTVENLAAINARKRFILSATSDDCTDISATTTTTHEDSDNLQVLLIRHDLRWLHILFTSPLKKHTKSPMLWQHRRWLFELLSTIPPATSSSTTATNNFLLFLPPGYTLLSELQLVFKAGELHPKNYYAWSYARWLVHRYATPTETTEIILPEVYKICKAHPSDVSAWDYLRFLLLECQQSQSLRLWYLRDTIGYMKIVSGHENLWSFVRTVTAWLLLNRDNNAEDTPPASENAFDMVKAIKILDTTSEDYVLWKKAIAWIDRNTL